MKKRIRNRQIIFWVSPVEEAMIEERMSQVGTKSLSAYLRKIAIDGMIINLQIPELKEIISLLRRCSNNLNQYARRANEGGSIYLEDIKDLKTSLENIWQTASGTLKALAAIS